MQTFWCRALAQQNPWNYSGVNCQAQIEWQLEFEETRWILFGRLVSVMGITGQWILCNNVALVQVLCEFEQLGSIKSMWNWKTSIPVKRSSARSYNGRIGYLHLCIYSGYTAYTLYVHKAQSYSHSHYRDHQKGKHCSWEKLELLMGFLVCFSGSEEEEGRSQLACGCTTPADASKSKNTDTYDAHRDFMNSTALLMDTTYRNHESLPSLHDAYAKLTQIYPKYEESQHADDIRAKEYNHLQQNDHVCMDYFGFGLFSHLQQHLDIASSSFNISYTSANLSSLALYGAPDEGSIEFDIRNRITRFLNIMEDDYSMVFTATRGSAFKLLAESYPFHINRRLLTVYDYESEGLNWMIETSKKKGAKFMSASFKWPSLRICSAELRKLVVEKKKKKNASAKGLFVFPVQSRLTGTKYSYQWMSHAQQNGWHVLLDACALGPKDMDSLGLSFFRPDFIICSFFKVYGEDPTGFGCLFMKNSSLLSLHSSTVARGVGMVKIVPIKRVPTIVPVGDGDEKNHEVHERQSVGARETQLEDYGILTVSSFSGPVSLLDRESQSQKTKCINISEHEESESDDFHINDTESAVETEHGSELRKFGHRHHSSYSDSPINEFTDDDYTGDDNGRYQKDREEGCSPVQEIEALEEEKERQTQTIAIPEQENLDSEDTFQVSESQPERKIEGIDEITHRTCHKGKALATDSSELDKGRNWAYGETSGTTMESPIEDEHVIKSILSDISEEGKEKPSDENTRRQEEKESMESESANGIEALSREPQIHCRSLDHADSLGLIIISNRLRYLTNWLVNALLKLRHPSPENGLPLVKIYGPRIKFDRGPAVAFNLYDWKGELVEPMLVQKLADRSNISLGYGFVRNMWFPEKYADKISLLETKTSIGAATGVHGKTGDKVLGLTVVTAAIGFLTNFEDVYRLWAFVAKFLDADFVAKERWRYRTLNQQTVEVEKEPNGTIEHWRVRKTEDIDQFAQLLLIQEPNYACTF
eukprot:Gb_37045 [translate_table: standard]